MLKKAILRALLRAILVCSAVLPVFPQAAGDRTVAARPDMSSPGVTVEVANNTPKLANGKIAFYSSRDKTPYELYSMEPDGSGIARLTNDNYYDWYPAYSPDGKKIAFARGVDTLTADIYVMNDDGTGSVSLITTTSRLNTNPSWSPDGTRIVYMSKSSSQTDTNSDIWVLNAADGSNPVQLTADASADTTPAWSPDGTRIAWRASRTGSGNQIWLMDAGGANPVQLTSEASGAHTPAWSPDGSRITFNSGNNLFTINVDGTGRTQVTSTGKDYSPAWSPDGTRIAFMSMRSGFRDIYVMNADGSDVVQLTKDTYLDEAPSWQPVDSTVYLTVNEAISVSDVPLVLPSVTLTVDENITVSDLPGVFLPVSLTVEENITVSDSPGVFPPVSLTVNENITVSDSPGVFPPVSLIVNENITVSDSPGVFPPVSLTVGENITVSDSTGVFPPVTLTVEESITVSDAAAFPAPTYVLTMAVDGSGTTDPAVGTHVYDEDTVVAITAMPDGGWRFENWAGNVADPKAASTTVILDADKTVTANFVKVPLRGDANGDGIVDSLDVTAIERLVALLDPPTTGADANGDGSINALDITKTERLVAGLD